MLLSTYLIIDKIPLNMKELLRDYVSPDTECSLFSGIPYTKETLDAVSQVGKLVPITVRFRGSRSQPTRVARQSTCLKKDAKTFAVYLKIPRTCQPKPRCNPISLRTHLLGFLLVKEITKFDTGNGAVDDIFNKYVGTGDILSAQDELIDAGYTDQARL
jgi:hypothetical protein